MLTMMGAMAAANGGGGKGGGKGVGKGEKPCFTERDYGECTKPDCPFKHEKKRNVRTECVAKDGDRKKFGKATQKKEAEQSIADQVKGAVFDAENLEEKEKGCEIVVRETFLVIAFLLLQVAGGELQFRVGPLDATAHEQLLVLMCYLCTSAKGPNG